MVLILLPLCSIQDFHSALTISGLRTPYIHLSTSLSLAFITSPPPPFPPPVLLLMTLRHQKTHSEGVITSPCVVCRAWQGRGGRRAAATTKTPAMHVARRPPGSQPSQSQLALHYFQLAKLRNTRKLALTVLFPVSGERQINRCRKFACADRWSRPKVKRSPSDALPRRATTCS